MGGDPVPYRARRLCRIPGCPEKAQGSSGLCQGHLAEYDAARGSAAKRGYNYRWQKARAHFLTRHPICEDPDGRHPQQVIQATEVDHKIPRARGGSDHPDNLQALCKSCHSAKTLRETGAGR